MPQMPAITIQLVHIQGPLKGQVQDFSQFPVHIGRHSSCQVRFDKDLTTLSRRHARIDRQGNRFRIVDASTNGTYVNGKRIANVYLRDGDVITFTENGPKASFLTKIEVGDVPAPHVRSGQPAQPMPPSPVSASHPQMPAPASAAAPVVVSSPAPPAPEPGLTAGPGLEISVISANAPLVIQFGPTLQSYNLLPVTIGTDPTCDFVIDDNALAGRHIQIFFSEKQYYAKDLTESGMVSINGRPVGTQSVMAQGAELSLTHQGPRFRFLGGGRLAQIQDVVSESLEKTDAEASHPGSENPSSVP
ncbi:FHA domain-containing protein [Desulfosarcina sp.]|uniref:FHA domain-containing protein n=1 Tax=Desulfosarcina sp. TaxID=2027861 RepID=UPI00356324B9